MSTNPVADLKKYADVHPEALNNENIMAALLMESDRAAVIVAANLLEISLEDVLAGRMNKLEKKERKDLRLFEPDGLVGSFGHKIDMAFALNLIDQPMRKSLHIIRNLRNACAHSFREMTFKNVPTFKAAVASLFDDGMNPLVPAAIDQTPYDLKGAFVMECMAMSIAIHWGRKEAMRYLKANHPVNFRDR